MCSFSGLEYIGCYYDASERALPSFQILDISLGKLAEQCIEKCRSLNHPFAGLQHKSQCFCGTTFSRYGKADDPKCNTLCADSSGRYCGGIWKNSVYKTCK